MLRKTEVQTSQNKEVINVTAQLADMVTDIKDGLALFHVPHTTAALVITEDEEKLRLDILNVVDNLLAGCRPFVHIRHDIPNAEAHIFSALAGCSVTVPVIDGKLAISDHQALLLIEMEGPKRRSIHCQAIDQSAR